MSKITIMAPEELHRVIESVANTFLIMHGSHPRKMDLGMILDSSKLIDEDIEEFNFTSDSLVNISGVFKSVFKEVQLCINVTVKRASRDTRKRVYCFRAELNWVSHTEGTNGAKIPDILYKDWNMDYIYEEKYYKMIELERVF